MVAEPVNQGGKRHLAEHEGLIPALLLLHRDPASGEYVLSHRPAYSISASSDPALGRLTSSNNLVLLRSIAKTLATELGLRFQERL